MAKEFRFVEWVGAVLGFLIGLVQVMRRHAGDEINSFPPS
jgi:hypothetical protein